MLNREKQTAELTEAIKAVIKWFDIFDFPLTTVEIWRFLGTKTSLGQIQKILTEQNITGLETACGFWFLAGKSAIINTRLVRQNYADRKIKKAIKLIKLFSWLPWIRFASVVNLMGPMNMKDGGDIDFFIITAPRRLWLTRLIMTLPLKILGLRPGAANFRDTYCLSFFVDSEHLNLTRFKLKTGEPDLYLTRWTANILPILDKDFLYYRLINENFWLGRELPNWRPLMPASRRRPQTSGRDFRSSFFDFLENFAKKIQIKFLAKSLAEIMNTDTRVVINEHTLKLHNHDRRAEFEKLFYETNI